MMAGRAKKIFFVAILVLLPVAAVALVEGAASLALFARELLRANRIAEESHTEPDTLLGWINRANISRPDFYAPGLGFHTNTQRFRHQGDVADRPPAGKRRIVCSGDSFALGYGVDDNQTWCAVLARADTTLETVNMGQGGYGIDQAYLWYLRDGLPLHADLQIFTFIERDFARMETDQFRGYPKPTLMRDGDSVRARGVPVKAPGLGRALLRFQEAAGRLATYQVLAHFSHPPPARRPDSTTWALADAAWRHLERRNHAAGTALVVVFLPRQQDYATDSVASWRSWASEAAARGDFKYIDLIEPFRKLAPDSVPAMFIAPGVIPFAAAAGHYSAAGNAWVAEQLRRRLPSLLAAASSRPPTTHR